MYVYVVSYETRCTVVDSVFDTKEKAIEYIKKEIENRYEDSVCRTEESVFGGFMEFYVDSKDRQRLITYHITTRYVY